MTADAAREKGQAMSIEDKLRAFADAREYDATVVRDGFTYGDVRELQKSVASLNSEVHHWHQQCNQRDAQITELEGQIADAGNDYCKLSIEHAELAKEHALQVSERRSLEVRLADAHKAWQGCREEYTELAKELDALRTELGGANLAGIELAAQTKALEARLNEAQRELERRTAWSNEQIANLRGQVDDWRATCHGSDSLGSQWQERAQEAEAFLRRLTADDFDKTTVGEALWVEIRDWLRTHGQG